MRIRGAIVRALIVALAAGTTVSTMAAEHSVPFFPSASDDHRQGFVRIINHSMDSGEISVAAVDDHGRRFGPISLTLDADEALHFNSDDLEHGNPDKGLSGQTGPGAGDWRLEIEAGIDIEVLSYVRTSDGFLTAMHDVAPVEHDSYRVPTFNPGSNSDQVSLLRLTNPGEYPVEVAIRGTDDSGDPMDRTVRVSIDPGASRTFTAAELETGGSGMQGRLGDGDGKWRLAIESARPIVVMNLLSSPTGHLTNLTTDAIAPLAPDGDHLVPLFPSASDEVRQGFVRVINRSDQAGEVRIEARDRSIVSHGPATLTVGARQAVHFNSNDLELGNANKGLSGRTGAGIGDWRLVLSSDLDIDVLAYIRTRDGFLTAIGNVVPSVGRRHRVAIFNPGRNTDQTSLLRLINLGELEAHVMIEGVDDRGRSSTVFQASIPPRGTRTLTAEELEAGLISNPLGYVAGKWRLAVSSVSTPGIELGYWSYLRQPIAVMSLLSNPSGHLTNLSTARRCPGAARFRDVLADGGNGPEMVVIPDGRFDMGCTTVDCDDGAEPVHEVTIAEPFALSRTEVTFAQWDACVEAGGCNGYSPRDRYWGRLDRPVIYVGRDDAEAYASWLSAETGADYRLPSEAEWEYAARAGSPASYSWGDTVGEGRANCVGCGGQWNALKLLFPILGGTAPVGTFGGNAFCLHDMHGNVAEWVADYWTETYDGAPTDGRPLAHR